MEGNKDAMTMIEYLARCHCGALTARYRTPVDSLYLCGASTWPGAGTGAGSGFLLAKMLAR